MRVFCLSLFLSLFLPLLSPSLFHSRQTKIATIANSFSFQFHSTLQKAVDLPHLAQEGIGPALELPLLRARLPARGLGEGVQHLVSVDQVLVADGRGIVAA